MRAQEVFATCKRSLIHVCAKILDRVQGTSHIPNSHFLKVCGVLVEREVVTRDTGAEDRRARDTCDTWEEDGGTWHT